jgi:hypothetical protein
MQRAIDETYQDYMAKIALTIASNCHIESGTDFGEIRASLFGFKPSSARDVRTAEEIIADTMREHKMTIKEEG